MNKLLTYIRNPYYVFFTIATFLSFFVSIERPIWLDECYTLINTDVDSLKQLFYNFYNGADTNPPFYFFTIFLLKFLPFNELILLRISSLIYYLGGVFLLAKIVHSKSQKQYLFLIASTIPFLNFYLSSELRAYALQFFLASCFVSFYEKAKNRKYDYRNITGLIIASTLLLYTHYFSIFYLLMVFVIETLFIRKNRNYAILLSVITSFILFSPWIPVIFKQKEVYHGFNWQVPFNLFDIYKIPYFYLGNSIYIYIIAFCFVFFIHLVKNKLFLTIISIEKKHVVIISLLLFPFIGALLSNISSFPFVERYFSLSIISFLIIASFVFSRIRLVKLELLLLVFLGLFVIIKSYNYFRIVESQKYELSLKLELLNKKEPVVCESPHFFYPLYYYAKHKNLSLPFLVLDKQASIVKGNSKNAIFDYYGNKNLKKYFELPNVLEFETFIKFNKNFYLLDEGDRQLFEWKIKNDSSFTCYRKSKNLLQIISN